MTYIEDTNTISMSNALPPTDATGKKRLTKGEYFDFTVSGTVKGSKNINWEIAAEDVTPSMFYTRERGTTVYSRRSTNWTGKVGLMYPSDYGYATSGGSSKN